MIHNPTFIRLNMIGCLKQNMSMYNVGIKKVKQRCTGAFYGPKTSRVFLPAQPGP